MDGLDIVTEILPFVIPLLIIQIALIIVALIDLIQRDKVRGNNKVLWALLIVLVNIIGPIIYLFIGREE